MFNKLSQLIRNLFVRNNDCSEGLTEFEWVATRAIKVLKIGSNDKDNLHCYYNSDVKWSIVRLTKSNSIKYYVFDFDNCKQSALDQNLIQSDLESFLILRTEAADIIFRTEFELLNLIIEKVSI